MVIAALEATFRSYLDEEWAVREVPVLQMLALTKEDCYRKCEQFIAALEEERLPVTAEIVEVTDMVGGGSYPEYTMPSYAVALTVNGVAAAEIERRLRLMEIPVIARVQHDKVCFAVRTIQENEGLIICRNLERICADLA